jgi:hypothetical protein
MERVVRWAATSFQIRSRVTLPRHVAAPFPDRCIRCGRDHPRASTLLVEYEFRSRHKALEFATHNGVKLEPWSEPSRHGSELRNRA